MIIDCSIDSCGLFKESNFHGRNGHFTHIQREINFKEYFQLIFDMLPNCLYIITQCPVFVFGVLLIETYDIIQFQMYKSITFRKVSVYFFPFH